MAFLTFVLSVFILFSRTLKTGYYAWKVVSTPGVAAETATETREFCGYRRYSGPFCYDDHFIVKLAYESDGIIVSNVNYRDLANEKPEWKKFIHERLLMYSFVNDN